MLLLYGAVVLQESPSCLTQDLRSALAQRVHMRANRVDDGLRYVLAGETSLGECRADLENNGANIIYRGTRG